MSAAKEIKAGLIISLMLSRLFAHAQSVPAPYSSVTAPDAKSASTPFFTDYSVTNLGTLGGNTSMAYGINESGQVVGESRTSLTIMDPNAGPEFTPGSLVVPHAFLYSGNNMQDLGGRANSSAAHSINATGQAVGFFFARPGGYNHAFLYSNSKTQDIGSFGSASARQSFANAINASGQVVGWSDTGLPPILLKHPGPMVPAASPQHAFSYQDGKMQDLGTLGGDFSTAFGINDAGQIAGYAENADRDRHAFLYENGKMRDLGTLGGLESEAHAINNSGQVVGVANLPNGDAHAFLYSDGKMQDLGTLDRNPKCRSQANAINSAGLIVGYSKSNGLESHAFLYRNGHIMDLNNLVSAAKLEAAGLSFLSTANGINDKGQIVGVAKSIEGYDTAVLLTPPDQSATPASSASTASANSPAQSP
jgi:probable HAF family extracellular repeat protein